MFQSGYFAKFFGVLMTVAGLAFIVSDFTAVLAPQYQSGWLPALMMPGSLLLTVLLLFRGVDLPRWQEKLAGGTL
jgi:uncharacterized protein DUF4386